MIDSPCFGDTTLVCVRDSAFKKCRRKAFAFAVPSEMMSDIEVESQQRSSAGPEIVSERSVGLDNAIGDTSQTKVQDSRNVVLYCTTWRD